MHSRPGYVGRLSLGSVRLCVRLCVRVHALHCVCGMCSVRVLAVVVATATKC